MISQQKQQLRQAFRQQRRSLPKEQRLSKELALNNLFFSKCANYFPNIKQLFCYLAIDGEPRLEIDRIGYRLALPVVRQNLLFCHWQQGEPLFAGKFTQEPLGWQPVVADSQTLVLIPCIAIDRAGYRLGFGKGYYDRFLADNPQVTSIGVCFDEFVVDSLPCEKHDRAVHFLLTDKSFHRTLTGN